jgi:hypothetical protein
VSKMEVVDSIDGPESDVVEQIAEYPDKKEKEASY